MALTRDSVLSLLIAEGGQVKKSDLVARFKASVDCADPAERERNRELFKSLVNSVAFVREIDGVRYVMVKKMYQRMLEGGRAPGETGTDGAESEEPPPTGEQRRTPARSERTESWAAAGEGGEAMSEPDQEGAGEGSGDPPQLLSPIQLALQRSKYKDIRVKRTLNFEIQRQDTNGDDCYRGGAVNEPTSIQRKPHGLPLRVPPSATRVEIRKLKMDPDDPAESARLDANKWRPPPAGTGAGGGSPQLRRSAKSAKESEEHKDTRISCTVPLDPPEHKWLVKCAAGHWSQVHGLLLRDSQLAEKRDFMSGFTALHWAAKCGNVEMLSKIIDLSRQGGVDIDINAKTHGGYTPLHIAALHNQAYVVTMLVAEFGADVSIRDNCGKRAYHYLHTGTSQYVRDMLGGPRTQQTREKAPSENEELDQIPGLSKGRHSISRLFQPHVSGLKKKHKHRPGFQSLSDDPSEEREASGIDPRQRVTSDVFM